MLILIILLLLLTRVELHFNFAISMWISNMATFMLGSTCMCTVAAEEGQCPHGYSMSASSAHVNKPRPPLSYNVNVPTASAATGCTLASKAAAASMMEVVGWVDRFIVAWIISINKISLEKGIVIRLESTSASPKMIKERCQGVGWKNT